MELQKIDNDQAIQTWNKLALKHADTITIAHNPYLFSFFSNFLKLSPFYLILYSDNKPIGLLPLVSTGKTFISMPHFSYGGVYWLDGKTDLASAEGQIIQNLVDVILKEKVQNGFYKARLSSTNHLDHHPIEVRSFNPMFNNTDANKLVNLIYLTETEQEQVKMFSSNLRRKISKASKNKLEIKSGKHELLNDFAKVYNRNMHRIGSPTLGKNFFKALLDIPETNAKLFVVYLNKKPIGGSFSMWYDGYYENTWFSTLADFKQLYPSYLLHAEMIRDAIQNKARIYSFGRSTKGSGVHQYKLQWPVEERELYFSANHKSGMNLKDQKWLTWIWKNLPPAFVNSVGPIVAKRIY